MKTAEKLLQMCINHMSERETYEEAITTDDLISEIQNYLSACTTTSLPSDEESLKAIRKDIISKHLQRINKESGIETFFAYHEAMEEYASTKLAEMEGKLNSLKGELILHDIMQIAMIKNEDGMPVVKYIDKPNGGSIAYVRYDAMVKKINSLLKL